MYLYNFVISVDASDPVVLRRSLPALRTLAKELVKECNDVVEVRQLAELVLNSSISLSSSTPGTNADATEVQATSTSAPEPAAHSASVAFDHYPPAGAIESALAMCLPRTNVVRSAAMGRFLHEDVGYAVGTESTSLHHAIPSTVVTATDFLLNPLEISDLYIPARRCKFLDFTLNKNDSLHWRFAVAYGHGVEFMALFRAIDEAVLGDSSSISTDGQLEAESKRLLDEYMQDLRVASQARLAARTTPADTNTSAPVSVTVEPISMPSTSVNTAPMGSTDKNVATSPSTIEGTPNYPLDVSDGIIVVRPKRKVYTGEKSRAPVVKSTPSSVDCTTHNTTTNTATMSNSNIGSTSASAGVNSVAFIPFCQDCFIAPCKGTCRIVWDNSQSLIYGKSVKYVVNIASERMRLAASDAAEEETAKSLRQGSSIYRQIFDSKRGDLSISVDGPWDDPKSSDFRQAAGPSCDINSGGGSISSSSNAIRSNSGGGGDDASVVAAVYRQFSNKMPDSAAAASSSISCASNSTHGSATNSSMVQEYIESMPLREHAARVMAVEAPGIVSGLSYDNNNSSSSSPRSSSSGTASTTTSKAGASSSATSGVGVVIRVGNDGVVVIDGGGCNVASPSAAMSSAISTENARPNSEPSSPIANHSIVTTTATDITNRTDSAAVPINSLWDTTYVPTGSTWKENAYDIATSIGSLALDNKYGQMASTFAEKYVVGSIKGLSGSSAAEDRRKLPETPASTSNDIISDGGVGIHASEALLPGETHIDDMESASDINSATNEASSVPDAVSVSSADEARKGYYSYYIHSPVLAATGLLSGLLAKTHAPLLSGSSESAKDTSERSLASIDRGGAHGTISPLTTTMHTEPAAPGSTPTPTAAQFADILRLAQCIEALEDRCARLCAERDQSRAEGIRDRKAIEMLKSDLVAVEATLKTEEENASSWRDRALHSEAQLDLLRRVQEASISALSSENEGLQQRIEEESRARRAAEGRLEQVVLDQNVWGATRDSIHAQLSDSHRRAEEAVKGREVAELKLRDATQDRESLLERILTLEQQLDFLHKCIDDPSSIDAVYTSPVGSPTSTATATMTSKAPKAIQVVSMAKYADLEARYDHLASQLRDAQRRLAESLGDLEVLRYQSQIDESKIREISRQNATAVSLFKAEIAESQMLCELYRDKLQEVKTQKRILVQELRTLRDLGVYKVPLASNTSHPINASSGSNGSSSSTNAQTGDGDVAVSVEVEQGGAIPPVGPSSSNSSSNINSTSNATSLPTTTAISPTATTPVASSVLNDLRDLRAKYDTVSAALACNPSDKSLSAIADDLRADIKVMEAEAKRMFAQSHDDELSSHGASITTSHSSANTATNSNNNSHSYNSSTSVTADPSHHLWLSKLLSRERS